VQWNRHLDPSLRQKTPRQSMTTSSRPPWKRRNPRQARGKGSKRLSPQQKATARARARKAGRRYPNLVDNMRVAARATATKKRSTRKKAAKKSGGKPRSATVPGPREKDPRGGLTAAGRRKFAETQGAHLKPGVRKKISQMTPTEMRRKGSWAVRFYGRKPLPPLVDKAGRPTRLALSAHAWGEPVPKTPAAARKIAAKGRRLLARYQRTRKSRR
jgi:hypothetical protein